MDMTIYLSLYLHIGGGGIHILCPLSCHHNSRTVPTFNSCTKCVGSSGKIHDRMPDCLTGMGARTTSQLNVALIRKLRGPLMCLTYYFDMLSMGVCTTRHWQTTGRLVQELNVCTVPMNYNLYLGRQVCLTVIT